MPLSSKYTIYHLHMIQSHQQLPHDPRALIPAVLLCTPPSALCHMHTLPTTGVSNEGSIAAEVSLGRLLLHNSIATADDKENLLRIPNKHKPTPAIPQRWPEARGKAMLQWGCPWSSHTAYGWSDDPVVRVWERACVGLQSWGHIMARKAGHLSFQTFSKYNNV